MFSWTVRPVLSMGCSGAVLSGVAVSNPLDSFAVLSMGCSGAVLSGVAVSNPLDRFAVLSVG